MQQFDCPFCGPRDQPEFTYGREAAPIPDLDASRDAWQRYVFERENPCGPHAEWWHHTLGCRQWLVIVRDTLTHVAQKGARVDFPGGGVDEGGSGERSR